MSRAITKTFEFICQGCGRSEIKTDTKRNHRTKCCSPKCASNMPYRKEAQSIACKKHIGQKRSEETKRNMSIAQKKRPARPKEEKERLRTMTIGAIPWNKGLTKETSSGMLRVSRAVSKYNIETGRNPGGWSRGQSKANNASLAQMSESLKQFYIQHPGALKNLREVGIVSRCKGHCRPTSIESALYNILENLGIHFEREVRFERWVPDILIPERNIFILADGDYWHDPNKFPSRGESDISFNIEAVASGFSVYRFSEGNIKKDLSAVEAIIKEACKI